MTLWSRWLVFGLQLLGEEPGRSMSRIATGLFLTLSLTMTACDFAAGGSTTTLASQQNAQADRFLPKRKPTATPRPMPKPTATPVPQVPTPTPAATAAPTPTPPPISSFAGPGTTNRPASIPQVNATGTLGFAASQKGLYIGQIQYTWNLGGLQNDPIGLAPNPPSPADTSYQNIQWSQFNMYEDHYQDMWCNEWNAGLGNFDFTTCDNVANAAIQHGQKIMSAAYFAWNSNSTAYSYMPAWIQNLVPTSGNASVAQDQGLQTALTTTINGVMSHLASKFHGLVQSYVVVNEPIDLNTHEVDPRMGWSYIGTSSANYDPTLYIKLALQTARAALKPYPSPALLCMNAEGNFWGQDPSSNINTTEANTAAYLALVDKLNAEQQAIDGTNMVDCMGFESHLSVYQNGQVIVPTLGQIEWTMEQYAQRGMQVEITELDFADASSSASANTAAQYYARLLQACVAEPNCTVFNQFTVVPRRIYLAEVSIEE